MARRRTRSLAPVLVIILVLLAAAAAWRYGPSVLQPGKDAATPLEPPRTALDLCGLVTPENAAGVLGVEAVEARHVGAAADVPAAGSCTWNFGADGSVVALAFTPDSLRRSAAAGTGHEYYDSVVTGMEYALKTVPQPIANLGDEAAAAGFGRATTENPALLVVRSGDTVLQLAVNGADRDAAERFARVVVEQL